MTNWNLRCDVLATGARVLVVLSVLLASGCSRIEVKRDSPESCAATLIKIYGEKKYELLDQVTDPVAVRAEKRGDACLNVSLEHGMWQQEMLESVSKTLSNPLSAKAFTKPEPDVLACTCGKSGSAAASVPGLFVSSHLHAALEAASFDAQRCSITDAKDLVGNARNEKIDGWQETACQDVSNDAQLSLVTVKCGQDATVGLVMRKVADGWRMFRLDNQSSMVLGMTSSANKSDAAEKKKRENLNKDLK